MGLKTTNYNIPKLGITISNAYAKITNVLINNSGRADYTISIQQERSDIGVKQDLDRKSYSLPIDKTLPIYDQLYTYAKTHGFENWEDDIV